jgi:hypothetical protein
MGLIGLMGLMGLVGQCAVLATVDAVAADDTAGIVHGVGLEVDAAGLAGFGAG